MELSEVLKKKASLKGILHFITGLYHSGKMVELCSFVVWELKYKLSLFGKNQQLKFDASPPLRVLTNIDNIAKIKEDCFETSRSSINWSLVFKDQSQDYWGTMYNDQSILYHYSSEGTLLTSFQFEDEVLGLYITKTNIVFCCANGIVYRKAENEKSFKEVVKFCTSESCFRIDAFTETPKGELFFGEYANVKEGKKWKFVGYIYYSSNTGNSWKTIDFLKEEGINKHVHIIKWSDVINGLILTDGDNQKNIWINTSESQFEKSALSPRSGWKKINKNHISKGGYTGFAELQDKIYLGTDYNGGTNFLISTNDMVEFESKVIPNPYRRAISDRLTVRMDEKGAYELWSTLQFGHSGSVRNLVMVSKNRGETWEKIMEYDGTKFEISLISNSKDIAKELFLLIEDRKNKTASTLCIHS